MFHDDPSRLTADERTAEIAAILARGVLRFRQGRPRPRNLMAGGRSQLIGLPACLSFLCMDRTRIVVSSEAGRPAAHFKAAFTSSAKPATTRSQNEIRTQRLADRPERTRP